MGRLNFIICSYVEYENTEEYVLALDIMKIFGGIYLYQQRNEADYWRFFLSWLSSVEENA
jgi:hypothetical protein